LEPCSQSTSTADIVETVADRSADQVPRVEISTDTAKAIEWLLHEVKDELGDERKKLIGRHVHRSGLKRPTQSEQSSLRQGVGTKRSADSTEDSSDQTAGSNGSAQKEASSISSEGKPGQEDSTGESPPEFTDHWQGRSNPSGSTLKKKQSAESTTSSSPRFGADGIVVEYKRDRGFGFIMTTDLMQYNPTGENQPAEIFFHVSDVEGRPKKGQHVKFDAVSSNKGLKANDVTIVSQPGEITIEEMEQLPRLPGFGNSELPDTVYQWGRSNR
jgi:cold shock CspA family protein